MTFGTEFGKIGKMLFENLGSLQSIWIELFGNRFGKTWEDPNIGIIELINKARKQLAESVGEDNDEFAHITLFMRDPLTDRLILEYSTEPELLCEEAKRPSFNLFRDIKQNYDPDKKYCFIDLCDSLVNDDEKRNEICRLSRSLTGWVAVSGLPLKVNNSRSKDNLTDKLKEQKAYKKACDKYGYPLWSYRVSEFPKPEDESGWSTRFMAIPINSVIKPNKTIGVLRFSCGIDSKNELSELDLLYFRSVAEIISVLKNMAQVKILCSRDALLEKEAMLFRQTGDFSSFLKFIASVMRSEICSLYISLKIKDEARIRLVDAHGISGCTGDLRDRIKDYSHERTGLTYGISKLCDLETKMEISVVDSSDWKGINTKIFYGSVFKKLRVKSLENKLEDEDSQKKLLQSHPIKLLGCNIKEKAYPVGVLKVEFPNTYDDNLHYTESDPKFIRECAKSLKEELKNYQNFINGKWFESANEKSVDDFLRYLSQINKFQLIVEKDQLNDFWENVNTFSTKYANIIEKSSKNKINQSSEKGEDHFMNFFKKLAVSKEPHWMIVKKVIISEPIKGLIKTLIN
jgi:hypothetical protein